ncbi:hypothetical protein [Peribacillus frigoritolerans]|uniref:hypothetical protein n=1 Tax=Peribacillus frigoritolerans TaxID=450367 RepID=UPI00241649E4|nr:hypothetical protein [Peribacillus frigoritolerans]MDG4846984.1 hypothetical protein [Peribacillus frigoritolerans]
MSTVSEAMKELEYSVGKISNSIQEQAASSNEPVQYTQQLTQLINDLEQTLGEFQIER